MAKASFKLPNGTTVDLDGTPEEIQRLLQLYGGAPSSATHPGSGAAKPPKPRRRAARKAPADSSGGAAKPTVDLAAVVRAIKDWDKYEAVEKMILDKPSQVHRTLLPLFAAHELMEEKIKLTSGDISRITGELGVPLSGPNVSHTLAGSARGYVHGDTVRKRGQPTRYQLTRRGVQYMKSVIDGTPANENAG